MNTSDYQSCHIIIIIISFSPEEEKTFQRKLDIAVTSWVPYLCMQHIPTLTATPSNIIAHPGAGRAAPRGSFARVFLSFRYVPFHHYYRLDYHREFILSLRFLESISMISV